SLKPELVRMERAVADVLARRSSFVWVDLMAGDGPLALIMCPRTAPHPGGVGPAPWRTGARGMITLDAACIGWMFACVPVCRSRPPMTTSPQVSFGALLKRHRGAAGLSQEELAARAGVGVRTISDLERDVARWPYPSTVTLLAEALRLDAAQREALEEAARRPTEAVGQPKSAPP